MMSNCCDKEWVDWTAVRTAITESTKRLLWVKASEHPDGGGLDEGAAMHQARGYWKALRKRGKAEKAGLCQAFCDGLGVAPC